jgi:hypothetical protein
MNFFEWSTHSLILRVRNESCDSLKFITNKKTLLVLFTLLQFICKDIKLLSLKKQMKRRLI